MARTVRHAKLDNPTARARLKRGRQPHYQVLILNKAHLGYRRWPDEASGVWLLRRNDDGAYFVRTLAKADDNARADGISILSFEQAKAAALAALETPRRGRLTVRQAMADYIDYLTARGKETLGTECAAAAHILPKLGDLEVETLTSAQLRRWLASVASAPARKRTRKGGEQNYRESASDEESVRRRRSSANRVAKMLRAALNLAASEKKITNAAEWGRRWKLFEGVDAARIRYLTLEEARRFLDSCDPEFRVLARAALETGARLSELVRLRVSDFDPAAGTLSIRKTKTNRARHVVLTEEGAAFFATLTVGRSREAPILTRKNGVGWKVGNQGRRMAAACERAGIHPTICFHTLRHTVGSLTAQAGVPLQVIAVHLGHSTVKVTEKNYAHLAPNYVAETVRRGAPRFIPND